MLWCRRRLRFVGDLGGNHCLERVLWNTSLNRPTTEPRTTAGMGVRSVVSRDLPHIRYPSKRGRARHVKSTPSTPAQAGATVLRGLLTVPNGTRDEPLPALLVG
jgi:hypothetical protein